MRYSRRKFITILGIAVVMSLVAIGCQEPLRAYLSVNSAKCKGCSICVGVCPADAIRIINGKAVIDATKCIECGRCVESCPVNAIY
jgi:NAD-dependent dihydropyrimidine dehydrogenase PreA subunit